MDDLASYLFEHTWDEDDRFLAPGIQNLDAWLVDHFVETSEGYEVTNISAEAVASVTEESRDLEGLIGAAVGYDVAIASHEVVDLLLFYDPVEVFPSEYSYYEREFLSDAECFRERSCPKVELNVSLVANYPLGITGESETRLQYHWIDTVNGPAAVQRSWTRWQPTISVDWLKVTQQYYLAVTLPQEDGRTRRVESMWMEAELLNANIPEGMALNMTIDTMAKTGEQLEAYVSGEK